MAEPAIKGSKPAPAANKNTPKRCKRQPSMLCIAEGGRNLGETKLKKLQF
ncbi:hypothetical protein AAF134_11555 [Synechococcus lacustris Tous-12m]